MVYTDDLKSSGLGYAGPSPVLTTINKGEPMTIKQAITKRTKLRAEGAKLRAKGAKLHAEGAKLHAEGAKLRAEGAKLYAEGDKLYAEGDKLYAEGNLVVINTIIEKHGPKAVVTFTTKGVTVVADQTYKY